MYKTGHTIAKTIPGGLKKGKFKVLKNSGLKGNNIPEINQGNKIIK